MQLRKTMFLLPNLFTVSSIFCGMHAISVAAGATSPREFLTAALFIVFAMFFDMVDGRVARMTRTQSEFGMQLDSLADMVSFGVAPAFLVYRWGLSGILIGSIDLGFIVAFGYVACGAIRLARFNVLAQKEAGKASDYFLGLPIPLAAGMIAGLVIVHAQSGATSVSSSVPLLIAVAGLSFLMVSHVRFRSFKRFRLTKRATLMVFALLAGATLLSMKASPAITMLLLLSSYLVVGIAEHLLRGGKNLVVKKLLASAEIELDGEPEDAPEKAQ